MMSRAFLAVALLAPAAVRAQQWLPGDSVALVRLAVQQRQARDADTALASWQATAHGYVRMASIVDQGHGPIERLMKVDELTVEVYGVIPNQSKQQITRWRDTSFLPNRISYHRDHLGIVANDFGQMIRLGDGEEVRNLLHPLSPAGLAHYLFLPGDTVTLQGPRGIIRVVQVDVRPRDPLAPGTVGTLFLDAARGALVRFRFTFTPASYLDRTVRDITVTLESSLQQNARWLPWRQAIVIRREDAALELPLYTVLRADWQLDDYRLGVTHPPGLFAGPLVSGPRVAPRAAPGAAPVEAGLATLPEAEFNVDEMQKAASAMLEGRVLNGLPAVRTALAGYSDLLHVNRAGGVIASYGLRFPVAGLTGRATARYAFSSRQLLGTASLQTRTGSMDWTLRGERDLVDLADRPVTSALYNSLTTAFLGVDHGDWTLLESGTLSVGVPAGATRFSLGAGVHRSRSVPTTFRPIDGTPRRNPSLGAGDAVVVRGGVSRIDRHGLGWRTLLEGGAGDSSWARVAFDARARPGRFDLAVEGGLGSRELPGYRSFALGGTGTLPGLPFRSLGGRAAARAEAGYRLPVTIPLPRFSFLPYAGYLRRVRLPSTLTPFLAAGVAWREMPSLPWRADGRVEPVAGLRLDLWGDLLRAEAGIALRHGRAGFALDIHPDWWPVF